jgi:signal transduction histidine kinase
MTPTLPAPAPQKQNPTRTIADLVTSKSVVAGSTPVSAVVRLFEADPQLDSVAVVEGTRIGLVARTRFLLQLGRRFGFAVFENRPIRLLMEEGSTVEASADPLEVVAIATQREPARICDDIVVVERGAYVGTVSMRSLLVHHKELLATSIAEVTALDQKNRRLEEVQRVQSELMAHMSHELRSPLQVMLATLRALAADPEMPQRYLRSLELVAKRGHDLLAIANNMLDLSAIESGALAPAVEDIELRPLLEEMLLSAEALAVGKPVRLQLALGDLPPSFRTDPLFLRRILTNLLSNAVQFTDTGTVAVTVEGDRAGLVLRVADTGRGIRQEDMGRLFTRFAALDGGRRQRHGGTGLGLAIVKGLVDELRGTITAESREGVGSVFTLRLPSLRPADPRRITS